VIGKVCPRGKRVDGLIRYLYATGPAQQEGRGRRNPHTNPRVIAGFEEPGELEPSVGEGGRRDFRRLVSLLEQPLAAAGVDAEKKPVYHLVIAARKDHETGEMVDRHLSDEEWRDIAETYMDRIGLAPRVTTSGAGGSRCGTPMTTCTSSPPSPARTAAGFSRATTSGGPVRPAARSRPSTG